MGATRGIIVLMALGCVAHAQYNSQSAPVAILKQIDRHNEDGSYSYGYEGADGSFKIESKHPTGEVYGKYGYVDDSGKLREVEYGASRRGFEPAGTGINVPPPTLSAGNNYVGNNDYDDGQYREDPTKYYKTSSSSSFYQQPQKSYNPPPQQQQYNPPQQQYYQPQQQQHQQYYQPPQHQQHHYQPPAQQHYYNPPAPRHHTHTPIDPNIFKGHPATNFNVESGSYSINYSG